MRIIILTILMLSGVKGVSPSTPSGGDPKHE